MNKNYLTQVVILFLLTIGILFGISTFQSNDTNFTIKKIDILANIRNIPVVTDSLIIETAPPSTTGNYVINDTSIATDTIILTPQSNTIMVRPPITITPQRKQGDITLIEDYTIEQAGLLNFEKAINSLDTLQRPVRIAVLGDSFIEADILTENIRQLLQDMYGGHGVGYVAMHSDFPGFRYSVSQSSSGWDTYSVASKPDYSKTSLTLQLHCPKSEEKAITNFKGVKKLRHLNTWDISKIGFIAGAEGVISVKSDSSLYNFEIKPENEAQFIVIEEHTHTLQISCEQSEIAFWGAWLDGTSGIAVDNVSIRGYSGTTLQNIPNERLRELNKAIPYDLIVLQYGLNRMKPTITDYSKYTTQLVEAITHLKSAFPKTDILIIGVSDRCQNIDNSLQTMDAVYGIIKAQRDAAIETQCHFWDCCETMKTLGGMPTFVEKKWAHKDYTHLGHAGGKPLAEEFVKALKYILEKDTLSYIPQSEEIIHE